MQFVNASFSGSGVLNLLWITAEGEKFRETRLPGDDLSDLPGDDETIAAASSDWTPEFVAAWNAAQTVG